MESTEGVTVASVWRWSVSETKATDFWNACMENSGPPDV